MSDLCHIYYHEYLVKHWQSIAAVWAVQASQSPRTAVWSGLTFLLTDGSRYSLITEWPAVTEPFREFFPSFPEQEPFCRYCPRHKRPSFQITIFTKMRLLEQQSWDKIRNKSWQSAGSVLRRGNSILNLNCLQLSHFKSTCYFSTMDSCTVLEGCFNF